MNVIDRLNAIEVTRCGRQYNTSQLCYMNEFCRRSPLAQMIVSGQSAQMTYPFTVTSAGDRVYLGDTLGGVQTTATGGITAARALQLNVHLEPDPFARLTYTNAEDLEEDVAILANWSRQFDAVLDSTNMPADVRVTRWSQAGAFAKSVADMFRDVWIYTAISLAIVLVTVVVACLARDTYTMRPGVAVTIVYVIVAGVVGALSVQLGVTKTPFMAESFVFMCPFVGEKIYTVFGELFSTGRDTSAAPCVRLAPVRQRAGASDREVHVHTQLAHARRHGHLRDAGRDVRRRRLVMPFLSHRCRCRECAVTVGRRVHCAVLGRVRVGRRPVHRVRRRVAIISSA